MPASVRFQGFESKPELRQQLEKFLPDLEAEVGRWANRVRAVFELKNADSVRPFVWLTLRLELPLVSGEESGVAAFSELKEPGDFRRWVRSLWGNLLDKLLEQRAVHTEKELADSYGG